MNKEGEKAPVLTLSMTGFGRAEGMVAGRRAEVEVKSVNHRWLELRFYLSRELQALELSLGEVCRRYVSRGRLEMRVNLGPAEGEAAVRVNRALAAGLIRAWQELKTEFNLGAEPEAALLALLRDVIVVEDSAFSGESWPELERLAAEALEALRAMRAMEGAALAAQVEGCLARVEELLVELEKEARAVVPVFQERLWRRAKELAAEGVEIEGARLAQEIALFADRADVSEEVVRARSHAAQFRRLLGSDGPKGRKLDFLLQELFREITTAANKAQSAAVSALAVEIKAELEKMREQVQNLE